jgi:hypothetical protein
MGACCLFAFHNWTPSSLEENLVYLTRVSIVMLPFHCCVTYASLLRLFHCYVVTFSLLWGGICFHCCANEGIQLWRTIQLLRYRGTLICHNINALLLYRDVHMVRITYGRGEGTERSWLWLQHTCPMTQMNHHLQSRWSTPYINVTALKCNS